MRQAANACECRKSIMRKGTEAMFSEEEYIVCISEFNAARLSCYVNNVAALAVPQLGQPSKSAAAVNTT